MSDSMQRHSDILRFKFKIFHRHISIACMSTYFSCVSSGSCGSWAASGAPLRLFIMSNHPPPSIQDLILSRRFRWKKIPEVFHMPSAVANITKQWCYQVPSTQARRISSTGSSSIYCNHWFQQKRSRNGFSYAQCEIFSSASSTWFWNIRSLN